MRFIIISCGLALAASGFAESGKLTLERALELARQRSPELKAARLNTLAAEQAVLASGRWLSPSIEFEAEGVGGDLDGFREGEYTVALKQTFERGGKRKNERAVAERAIGVAFQAEAEKELALSAAVHRGFIEVLAWQEIGAVRIEQERLGEAFLAVATKRRQAGAASELEVVQAELALEETRLERSCCSVDLEAARARLASLIGLAESSMPELEADYYALETLDGVTLAESHPALRRATAEVEMVRARAAAARSKDAADLTLAAGYRREEAVGVNTFVFGAEAPLNFARAGKAEQAATLTLADALEAERDETRRAYQRELESLLAAYRGAKLEAERTRDTLTPRAVKAYELSKAGYDAGRYSWLELISTQQHLAEIKVREIEALRAAHVARADITKFMTEER